MVVFAIIFAKPLFNSGRFLYELLFNKSISLRTENNTLHILLLGIGGGKHEGPDLTDTIIVAHIDQKKNKIQLFSLPRDLWVPDLGSKINTAYAYGQEKQHKGILLSKSAIKKIAGTPIDYVVVIDFSGFVKLIDYLGGIDVFVKHSFDDYQYPIEGKENDLCGHSTDELTQLSTASSALAAFPCRYKHISFSAGNLHMNGQTALEFVRSRHAQGAEGSDFARSGRQQEVIQALKNKVLSLGLLLNPVKVLGVYNIIKGNINTDIQPEEYDDFIKLSRKMNKAEIKTYVIGTDDTQKGTYGLLTNPPVSKKYAFQWVLTPRRGNGDFSEIQEYIRCLEENFMCTVTKYGIEIEKGISPTASQNIYK